MDIGPHWQRHCLDIQRWSSETAGRETERRAWRLSCRQWRSPTEAGQRRGIHAARRRGSTRNDPLCPVDVLHGRASRRPATASSPTSTPAAPSHSRTTTPTRYAGICFRFRFLHYPVPQPHDDSDMLCRNMFPVPVSSLVCLAAVRRLRHIMPKSVSGSGFSITPPTAAGRLRHVMPKSVSGSGFSVALGERVRVKRRCWGDVAKIAVGILASSSGLQVRQVNVVAWTRRAVSRLPLKLLQYTGRNVILRHPLTNTRCSAVAERPRDASRHLTSCVDHKDRNDMWPTAASRGKNDIVWQLQIIRSTFGSRPNNIYAVVRFTTAYI